MYRFAPLPLALALVLAVPAQADTSPQLLPFTQNWSNIGLISVNDDWSGVPGIIGHRGDGLAAAAGADPRTILADGTSTPVDVNANQTNPDTYTTGGVTEFHLPDPVVALAGSGTASAPFLLITLDTTNKYAIQVGYTLRDLDGSADNAVQQVALQYRVGNSGAFTNLPAGYVADATEGPGLAGKTTPVSVILPPAADNQPLVQLRILTTNAAGNDEWVGVDDIVIDGTGGSSGNAPIVPVCPATLSVASGGSGSVLLSASDADSVVNAARISSGAQAGISLGMLAPATVDGGTASVNLDVTGLPAGTYPVSVRFDNDDAQSASCTVSVQVAGITPIPAIQGSGALSPLAGQTVTTEGVVTYLSNNGFYLQDPDGDGNPATSDGIFVFTGGAPGVAVGDRVRLTATVTEFNTGAAGNPLTSANPVTQLAGASISLLSSGHVVAPTAIAFPESTEGELERYEGMLVRIATPLTASQNFFLGRYGQVTLAAGGRLYKPTNLHRPGSAQAIALADENARRRILLDDGTSAQNPNPIPYIGPDNTLRAGDVVSELVGVIDYGLATNNTMGLADYRIHPVGPVAFSRENPRLPLPPAVGGNLRVASFNVLNYFTTLDQPGASCFPSGTRSDCRGADSAVEFSRQQSKIVAALQALDADVVGLMEVENNGQSAVDNLVAALNARMGAGAYASVALPVGGTGGDAIRMAMIYKPARVTPVGPAVSDTDPVHNRPPLAQTFAAPNGEKFTVIVNHFKSKGSCPAAGDANADAGDGQGCWNARRTQQAQALDAFAQARTAAVNDADVLVIGDLNAYAKEDPVAELVMRGYADLIERFNGQSAYSYVFDGEAGYLDHALATPSLAMQTSGAVEWHINADEPSVIDYNTEFKPQDLYTPTAYRSSDHDPVLVGLHLVKRIHGTAGRDVLTGTPGDDIIIGGAGADTLTGGGGRDVFVYTSLRDAGDVITDFAPGIDRIDLGALLTSLGVAQGMAWSNGVVQIVDTPAGASLRIDTDGAAGPGIARPLVLLQGVNAATLDPGRDLGL
ncbi:MAG: ExeM/NucH family extracellular endonuclease [Thiobacillus sp.]|nr:ExeM/NucH family extracellular endonuclease [Thiobacillus sp.]